LCSRVFQEISEGVNDATATEPVSHSVYVGNLPFTVDEDTFVELIGGKGVEGFDSLRLIIDKRTGRSRGFGYINYADKDEAEKAVANLNGASVEGRDLRVELSVPADQRPERPRRSRGGDENSVFIGNLDFNVAEEDIRSLCDEAGLDVVNVRLAIDRNTGRPRGFGHVAFSEASMVEDAISKLHDTELMGRNIRVDKAQRREDRPAREQKPSVYIGNLSWDVNEDLVKEMVDDVLGEGLYTSVRLALDRETGRHRGFGYVDFPDDETADRAVAELAGLEVMGRQLRADRSRPRGFSGNGGGGGRGGGGGGGYRNNDGGGYGGGGGGGGGDSFEPW
jgi:nucleolin